MNGFGSIFIVIWVLMFVLIFGVFLSGVVRSISQWNKDNHSPRLTVDAKVVTKRMNVRGRHRNDMHTYGATSYYVTFEVDSGDRMELHMAGHEYGLLVEGDRGKLTFQGTRYLGFERT